MTYLAQLQKEALMKNLLIPVIFGLLNATVLAQNKPIAIAYVQPTEGNTAQGSVAFFNEAGNQLRIVAKIKGLTPGLHGFHVHEKGDCSDPKGMSAGPHYNPDNQPHGNYHQGSHHAGDLPNLKANQKGYAILTYRIHGKNIADSGFLGRSIIIHADEDDYHSQPAGNSGNRIACGVIDMIKYR